MSNGETASTSGYNFTIMYPQTTASASWVTDSGTSVHLGVDKEVDKKGVKQISPTLYFKFVKSKLNKTQQKQLTTRLNKLKRLIPYAKECEQQAFYEELCKELVVLIKEQEIHAAGYGTNVDRSHIDKFKDIVKDRPIKFDKLENFPRVIPQKVRQKLAAVKKTKVFDEFWILYLDATKENLKSTSQKIQEKDPILFGQSKMFPTKFFYIDDWVDKYCDLIFQDFVDKYDSDEEFYIDDIRPIDESSFDKIKKDVADRLANLQETNSHNWREKVREEEKKKIEEQIVKRWWKFWGEK